MKLTHLKDKFVIETVLKDNQPYWKMFAQEFLKTFSRSDLSESHKFFKKRNADSFAEFRLQDPDTYQEFLNGVAESFQDKICEYAKSQQKLPSSRAQIKSIINLLHEGFDVEDAPSLLCNLIQTSELDNQIAQQQKFLPRSNFADTLVNFLVRLNPATPAIQDLQSAIHYDIDLACMIVPQSSPPADPITTIHSDLCNLKDINESHKALQTLLIRSFELGEDAQSLEECYLRQYGAKALLETNAITKNALAQLTGNDLFEGLAHDQRLAVDDQYEQAVARAKQIQEAKRKPQTCFADQLVLEFFEKQKNASSRRQRSLIAEQFSHPNRNVQKHLAKAGKCLAIMLGENAKDSFEIQEVPEVNLVGWAKNHIDRNAGEIRNRVDAYALYSAILDAVEAHDVANNIGSKASQLAFEEQFAQTYKVSLSKYVLGRLRTPLQPVAEDVVDFTPADQSFAKVWDVITVCSKIKNSLDQSTNLPQTLRDAAALIAKTKIARTSVLNTFEETYGLGIEDYARKCHSKLKTQLIKEGIDATTANKCRNALYKLINKHVDSSNIAQFSNVESYESHDKISLKLGVYGSSIKKLEDLRNILKDYLANDSWMNKDHKFIKGDSKTGVMVILHPVSKTFRSGPYKNRETPTLLVEIIGSKKQSLDSQA